MILCLFLFLVIVKEASIRHFLKKHNKLLDNDPELGTDNGVDSIYQGIYPKNGKWV